MGRIPILMAMVVTGCASLPALEDRTCGNHVVESNEDCDGFAPEGASACIEPGTAGECHFDCNRRSDGTRPACPAGWGCGVQGICRPPTGAFEASAELDVGGAWSLMTGDFDGDGRADLLDLERPDVRGGTKLHFQYLDDDGGLRESHDFPKTLYSPLTVRPAGASHDNVVFSDARFSVGVLLGQPDRSLVPEAFSSFHLSSSDARMISVGDTPIEDYSGFVILTTIAGARSRP